MEKQMNKLISLTLNDFRNIFRDDFLKYFFIAVPLLFILIIVFGVPLAVKEFPVVAGYTDIIITCFALEFPMLIGFVFSFMMLDEKDEKVFTALRIMPVSLFQFLFYRLFFAVFFTFLFIFLMLITNNLYNLTISQTALNSFLFALITPIVILLEVCFAGNKVTGFTMFKGINAIFMIPAIGFFIHSEWKFLMGIIPTYWPLNGLYNGINNSSTMLTSLFSIIYSIIFILILSYIFKRKVFRL